MKKLCLLLALVLLLPLLPACGSDGESNIQGEQNVTTANPNAGVILDCANLTMPIGAEMEIAASLIPRFESDDKTLRFESANPTVATVTVEGNIGKIKALAEGSTVITVTSADGLLAASCMVTVTSDSVLPPNTDPTGYISLSSGALTVKVGDSGEIKATVIPAKEGDDTTLSYTTSSDCIQLLENGVFQAKKEGTAVVTLSTPAGLTATVTITVMGEDPDLLPNPDAGITFDKTTLSLVEGADGSISATLVPRFEDDDKTLTFKSSNSAVASVDQNGKITANAPGTAVITVTSADGLLAASCTVTVTAKPQDNTSQLKVVNYPAKQVRHIFSHCLIAYPEYGCGDPSLGLDYGNLDVDCLTVSEFQILLESLYNNGYCLIDINDMYENYTDANGVRKARLKEYVQVYEGKKPLVISVDDVVYDSTKMNWGMIDRLEIQNGTIVGMKKINGKATYNDLEIFPQLEKFIASHPDFSFQGAKCTLALTGFEHFEVLALDTHQLCVASVAHTTSHKHGCGVARAEGLELAQVVAERRGDVAEQQFGINIHLGNQHLGVDILFDIAVEALGECRHILGFHRQTRCIHMATEVLQQVGARLNSLVEVEAGYATSRARNIAVAHCQHHSGAVVGLDKARSHDTNDTLHPLGIVDYGTFEFLHLGVALDKVVGLLSHRAVDALALAVGLVNHLTEVLGRALVPFHHQVYCRVASRIGVGIHTHTTCRIDTRADFEYDVVDGDGVVFESANLDD